MRDLSEKFVSALHKSIGEIVEVGQFWKVYRWLRILECVTTTLMKFRRPFLYR